MNRQEIDLSKIFALLFQDTNLFELYEFLNYDSDKMLKFLAIFMDEDRATLLKIPSKKEFRNVLRRDAIYENLRDLTEEERIDKIPELASFFKTSSSIVKQQFKKMNKLMSKEETKELMDKIERLYK